MIQAHGPIAFSIDLFPLPMKKGFISIKLNFIALYELGRQSVKEFFQSI